MLIVMLIGTLFVKNGTKIEIFRELKIDMSNGTSILLDKLKF